MSSADKRCPWAEAGDAEREYHDREWGVPVHADQRLFEMLVLEGAQAGLSWSTILRRRAGYSQAYRGFDVRRVAAFGEADQARLLGDRGIVRNRLKVAASVVNARAFLEVQAEFGSFDAFLWRFVDGVPLVNRWRRSEQVPASNGVSEALSRELKRRGFRFVGPTICYAYMQAVGLVNDHLLGCFRHAQICAPHRPRRR